MAEKRVSSTGSRSSVPLAPVAGPIPAGVPPLLRRFWPFVFDMVNKFSKHLRNPEEAAEEFLEAVKDEFKK